MLFLGIDQYARQLTISLRNDEGDVILARQVSTQAQKVQAFFQYLTRERLGSAGTRYAALNISKHSLLRLFHSGYRRRVRSCIEKESLTGIRRLCHEQVEVNLVFPSLLELADFEVRFQLVKPPR